jgi:hypothetical protein
VHAVPIKAGMAPACAERLSRIAGWCWQFIDELYADEPDIGVERKIRATAGLIRYDAKNDQLDWSQVTKDALTNDKPNAIIVMLGLNDGAAGWSSAS